MQRKITGLNLHDMACAMKAYKKEIINGITFHGKFDHSFIPYIIFRTKDIKIKEIKIRDNYRKFGKTKYKDLSTIFGVVFCFVKLFCIYGRGRKVRK